MQKKLLGIICVDFDATRQLLIVCSACVIYLRKNESTTKKAYNSVRREVLYNILIEFGIPMKLVRLINMCMNDTYIKVQGGKHLSYGLKLNGTRQLLVYADDVNILGGSVRTVKENVEALVSTSKETGPEVNVVRSGR